MLAFNKIFILLEILV